MSITSKSYYVGTALEPQEIRRRAKQALKGVQFDTIVGTGLSGLLPLQTLAREFEVHLLAVRKPNDSSHAGGLLEGTLGERWIFADDFICSGSTFNRVRDAINRFAEDNGHRAECVGAFCYDELGRKRFREVLELRDWYGDIDSAYLADERIKAGWSTSGSAQLTLTAVGEGRPLGTILW